MNISKAKEKIKADLIRGAIKRRSKLSNRFLTINGNETDFRIFRIKDKKQLLEEVSFKIDYPLYVAYYITAIGFFNMNYLSSNIDVIFIDRDDIVLDIIQNYSNKIQAQIPPETEHILLMCPFGSRQSRMKINDVVGIV